MAEVMRRCGLALGAFLLVALAPSAGVGAWHEDLPDLVKLNVPAGNKVATVAYAEGVQIYRWNGTAWAFVAPEAVLYSGCDDDDEVIAIHYAGPTWESASGSKVVGAVEERWTPNPNAIPWLKLKAVSSTGPGLFHRVTYIQRLFTEGGLAPSEPGDFVGEEARVPYSAWYVFYRSHK
jgi:hypothetical protein